MKKAGTSPPICSAKVVTVFGPKAIMPTLIKEIISENVKPSIDFGQTCIASARLIAVPNPNPRWKDIEARYISARLCG